MTPEVAEHILFHELTTDDPSLRALPGFLSRAYELKATADYETGAQADVPLEEARDAIKGAEEFVTQIRRALA